MTLKRSKTGFRENETTSNVKTIKLSDLNFDEKLFIPIKSNTLIDKLLSNKGGIMPATINMAIGDPGIGKSTITCKLLVDIKKENPDLDILFISSEMTEIDLHEYVERIPGLDNLEIVLLGNYIGKRPDHAMEYILQQSWDLVLIDSFADALDKCREEAGLTKGALENWLIELMVRNTKAENQEKKHTTFICIQHVTKGGKYVGSSKLKHSTTSMMEIRWDPQIPDGRYITFSKNRRGTVDQKLYFKIGETDVIYNEKKWKKDEEFRKRMEKENALLENEEEDWDKMFKNDYDEIQENIKGNNKDRANGHNNDVEFNFKPEDSDHTIFD